MATRLGNLRPTWLSVSRPNSGEGLQFDCPACAPEKGHRLAVYFENALDGQPMDAASQGMKSIWRRSGDDFKTLSIAPALEYPCFHGWLEAGKIFSVSDSPIVVLAQVGGQTRSVALSPMQTINGCTTAIQRAKVLLGLGATGDDPPARVVPLPGGSGLSLVVGDVTVNSLGVEDSASNGEGLYEMARLINAFFGYFPEVKIAPEVKNVSSPESVLVIPGRGQV